MKIILTLCLVFCAYANAKLMLTLSAENSKKMNDAMPSCVDKTGVAPDFMQQILDGKHDPADTKFHKFIYCLAKSMGIVNDDGTADQVALAKFWGKTGDSEFNEVTEECNKARGATKEETIAKDYECFAQKAQLNFNI